MIDRTPDFGGTYMVQKIIIGILLYLGMMVIISLFLQGCTRNEKAFDERREAEKYKAKQDSKGLV